MNIKPSLLYYFFSFGFAQNSKISIEISDPNFSYSEYDEESYMGGSINVSEKITNQSQDILYILNENLNHMAFYCTPYKMKLDKITKNCNSVMHGISMATISDNGFKPKGKFSVDNFQALAPQATQQLRIYIEDVDESFYVGKDDITALTISFEFPEEILDDSVKESPIYARLPKGKFISNTIAFSYKRKM
ncbi:hypothetical protein [Cellulophaga baltica]|uniref:hypothetical protein n=1 Tax=Cellulophaga baltica TaxID=76594 RepID=UPI0015F545E4|nr:hypothetical protein [Cellulophaga baltica]MBA6316546.1 hypothetical protein [Cellulophaga baltica]